MTSTARCGAGSRRLLGIYVAVSALLAAWLAVPSHADATAATAGYRDFSYSSSVTAPTGQKPESKLWYADGRWWGVLYNATNHRFEIYGFNKDTQASNAWTTTGVSVDVRRNSEADVLWSSSARRLYVITHLKDTDTSTADLGLKFLSYSKPAGGSYSLAASATVANRKVEAAVLDKDSTGKLWVTYTEPYNSGRRVMVSHSTTSDSTWVTPYALPVSGANTLNADDISTLVAYGDGGGRKIGVLWSNENAPGLYFAYHVDGASDSSWTRNTLCSYSKCPDDHLNIKSIDADANGHVFAAVKTSLNDATSPNPSDPLIVVYRLSSTGWSSSTAWRVADNVTRAIIVLDSTNSMAHVFAAGPCCSGGTVYRKSAPLSFSTAFASGLGTPFISSSGDTINNPTSTKQTVTSSTGLLVLAGADNTRYYVHNYLPIGSGSGGGSTVTLSTTADTYAAADSPSSTHGTSSSLMVDAVPDLETYVKFDLSSVAGKTITSASLRLRTGSNASGAKQSVFPVSSDTWTEGSLTYNNRPVLDSTGVGSVGPTSTSTTYNVTLNAATVQSRGSDGVLSLALKQATSTDDAVYFLSKESGTAPQLVLTVS